MAIDASAVGVKGEPSRRSWTSKDALLYAVGIGAGLEDLKFATENTKDTEQKVYPTFAVIVGGGGIPMNKVGSFNPALMVHGRVVPKAVTARIVRPVVSAAIHWQYSSSSPAAAAVSCCTGRVTAS